MTKTQCPFDIELHREIWEQGYRAAEKDQTERFRREAAKDAMCAMIKEFTEKDLYPDPDEICCMALCYADELIKQLKEEKE